MYSQNKNGNLLKFEFKEKGLQYTLKDKTVHKSEFIPFEEITNNTYEYFEKNETHKSRAIYFLVVGIVFLTLNILFKVRLWAWIFLLGAPISYFLYKKSAVNYKVLSTEGNHMDVFVLEDKHQQEIIDSIYTKRNEYLSQNYMTINYFNDPQNELSKFMWLKDLGLLSDKEFDVIREEIISNIQNR